MLYASPFTFFLALSPESFKWQPRLLQSEDSKMTKLTCPRTYELWQNMLSEKNSFLVVKQP